MIILIFLIFRIVFISTYGFLMWKLIFSFTLKRNFKIVYEKKVKSSWYFYYFMIFFKKLMEFFFKKFGNFLQLEKKNSEFF